MRVRRGDYEKYGKNVVFLDGEIVFARDKGALFVGDGVTPGGHRVASLLMNTKGLLTGAVDVLGEQRDCFINVKIEEQKATPCFLSAFLLLMGAVLLVLLF